MKTEEKHYLDSSVLVKLIDGSTKYKQYLRQQIKDRQSYVSPYVRMELLRGSLLELMDFYSVLMSSKSLSDANRLWTNRFSKRKLTIVMNFVSDMLEEDPSMASSKSESLKYLAFQIRKRAIFIKNKYKDPGNDSTHCPKPTIEIKPQSNNMEIELESFRSFIEDFTNDQECRNNCKIDYFISEKYRKDVDLMSDLSKSSFMTGKMSDGKGFIDICNTIDKAINKGKSGFTCSSCSKMGDATIALLAPKDMQIEHTDKSFDFICHAVQKPHRKLESENAIAKKIDDLQP